MRVLVGVMFGIGLLRAGAQTGAPVQTVAGKEVLPGVASFPHVVTGPGVTAEVVTKINALLEKQDEKVRAAVKDCEKSFHELRPDAPKEHGEWSRGVEVTMKGPRYLSLMAEEEYNCGGPHPDQGLILPLVYDLTTGRPVDWIKLLPHGARAALNEAVDGTRVGVVEWPWLQRRAMREADGDCKESFSYGKTDFALWLDGKAGTVMAQPFEVPHTLIVCTGPVAITVAEARTLGFAQELTDALAAAQATAAQQTQNHQELKKVGF